MRIYCEEWRNIMSNYVDELRRIQNLTNEEINEGKKNKLATEIVELFEELLDKKGIEIPCEDATEQKERYDGNNVANYTEWNILI